MRSHPVRSVPVRRFCVVRFTSGISKTTSLERQTLAPEYLIDQNAERRWRKRGFVHPSQMVFDSFSDMWSWNKILIFNCSSWTNRILAANDFGSVQVKNCFIAFLFYLFLFELEFRSMSQTLTLRLVCTQKTTVPTQSADSSEDMWELINYLFVWIWQVCSVWRWRGSHRSCEKERCIELNMFWSVVVQSSK